MADAAGGGEEPPPLVWKYSCAGDGGPWKPLLIDDQTNSFTASGLIEFLAPGDFAECVRSGVNQCWIRIHCDSSDQRGEKYQPVLNRMLLNTTWAAQTETVTDETLGSSNENKSQEFQTSRKPILMGQRLDVREPNEPPAAERDEIEKQAANDAIGLLRDTGRSPTVAEQAEIEKKERNDAIDIVRDLAGNATDIWVRWHEVDDFYESSPRARHYVVDHINGLICFGDGVHGMIPPAAPRISG